MFECPRCHGLVPPDSTTCPSCAYDPRTGRTVLAAPGGGPPQEAPASAWSSLLAGVTVAVAVVLVGVAIYLAVNRTYLEEPPVERNFATNSGTLPNGRR